MDKDIIREIFQLFFQIIRALGELLWKKIKDFFKLIWNRFFGTTDISYGGEEREQEWGVTGEDAWPEAGEAPEAPTGKREKSKQEVGGKESLPVSVVSEPQKGYEEGPEGQKVACEEKLPAISELPDTYGDNRIVLMMRDPACLFAYWEIKKDVLDKVLNSLGTLAHSAKIVLRVYDITGIIFTGNNAHRFFDIEITRGAENWYIHVGEPNRSFCADIGFITPNGTFRILARSNTVTTSRMDVSEAIDEKWMDAEGTYREAFIPSGKGIPESLFESMRKDWQKIRKEGASSPASLKH